MHNYTSTERGRSYLKNKIQEKAFISANKSELPIYASYGEAVSWYFDFRLVFSDKVFLENVAKLFWDIPNFNQSGKLQIGGLESASLPLITSIVLASQNASGFYIRKSRKKKMQLRQIEGLITADKEIVLVDDLINTGSSFKKQITILKAEGYKVKAIFTILKFRNEEFYSFLSEEGIMLYSLFSLEDFPIVPSSKTTVKELNTKWYFSSKKPNLFVQGPKNFPLVNDYIYTTSDDGLVWKIDKTTGVPVWQKKVMRSPKTQNLAFTGLGTIGNQLIFTTHRGSIAALDLLSGKPLYSYALTHQFTTPLLTAGKTVMTGYSEGSGSNQDGLLLFNTDEQKVTVKIPLSSPIVSTIAIDPIKEIFFYAQTDGSTSAITTEGKVIWKSEVPRVTGVTMNEFGDIVTINQDGTIHILDRHSGSVKKTHQVPNLHYSPPLCIEGKIYGATLDREVYCYNTESRKIEWSYETKGRMYSTPILSGKDIYVGDTFGMLHVIDRETGKPNAYKIVSERIVNPVVIENDSVYLSTFANELYKLERTPDESS